MPRARRRARRPARASGSRPQSPRPAARGRLERLPPDPTGADHERLALPQIAERPLGEGERHRARGRGIRSDRRLHACAPPCGDRGAEEQRQNTPRRRCCARVGEARSDLAENLRLPEHERVETGCDATQMPRDVLTCVDVEVVDEKRPIDAVGARQLVDQLVAGVVDALLEIRVQLAPGNRSSGRRARGPQDTVLRRARAPRSARGARPEPCGG